MSGTTAGLTFQINTDQVGDANQKLAELQARADAITQISGRMAQRFIDNQAALGGMALAMNQINPALAQASSSIDQLVQRMDALRQATNVIYGAFGDQAQQALERTALQLDNLAKTFGQTSTGVEMYARQARDLHLTTDQMVTSIQRVTEALRDQTDAGHQVRLIMQSMGVNLDGLHPSDAPTVLRTFMTQMGAYANTPQRFALTQAVLGPLDPVLPRRVVRRRTKRCENVNVHLHDCVSLCLCVV
jgi:chromosome segregation ATPase